MKKYFIILYFACFLQACEKPPTDVVANFASEQETAQASETILPPPTKPADKEPVRLDPKSITLPIDWEVIEKSDNSEVFDYIIDNFCEDENYNHPPKDFPFLDPCTHFIICTHNWEKLPPLADAGNPDAQNKLAHMYYDNHNYDCVGETYEGIGDPKHDPRKALDLFLRSATQGDVDSMLFAGYMYLEGPSFYDYPEQDSKEAEKWFLKAANKGSIQAALKLARLYTQGIGIPKDVNKARKWANWALKQDPEDASPNYYLGLLALDEKQYQKAADLFAACLDEDVPNTIECAHAKYKLSNMYTRGIGVKKDLHRAKELYENARPGETFDPLLPDENLTEVNMERLWRNAVYDNDPVSQYELGRRYENAVGVEKDLTRATEWYSRAAKQNYADALYALAMIDVPSPEGDKHFSCLIDYLPQQLAWLEKASSLGHKQASYELAKWYEKGVYLHGDSPSNGCLGRGWRYNDVLIGRDPQKAKYYYEKSGMNPPAEE